MERVACVRVGQAPASVPNMGKGLCAGLGTMALSMAGATVSRTVSEIVLACVIVLRLTSLHVPCHSTVHIQVHMSNGISTLGCIMLTSWVVLLRS